LNNKNKSQKQENKISKLLDMCKTISSGSIWFSKGDLKDDDFILEAKTTDNEKYTISRKLINKISEESFSRFKKPLIFITVQDKDYILMKKNDFIEISEIGEEKIKDLLIYKEENTRNNSGFTINNDLFKEESIREVVMVNFIKNNKIFDQWICIKTELFLKIKEDK